MLRATRLLLPLTALALLAAPCDPVKTTPDTSETICDDTLDNDNDALVDCDDPECSGVAGCPTLDPNAEYYCNDGADNDADGLWDCLDSDCCDDAACSCREDCANGVDDDQDGAIDGEDTDCIDPVHVEVRALGTGGMVRINDEWEWQGLYEIVAHDADSTTLCRYTYDWNAVQFVDRCPYCIWAFEGVRTNGRATEGERCDWFDFSSDALNGTLVTMAFGDYGYYGADQGYAIVYQPWWLYENGAWTMYAENDREFLNADGDYTTGGYYAATFSKPFYDGYFPR